MEVVLGFGIALAISLTGVGAGSMTTPLLILLLGVSPAMAVGTALTFGAIVKIVSAPVYVVRRQVNKRVLLYMLAGGVPGVLGGSFFLRSFKGARYEGVLYATLGILIAGTASFHLFRMLRPKRESSHTHRPELLPWFTLAIGAEVGFSSAGAGALGSLLLFGMTKLSTAEVVGTDLCFGLAVSSIGSVIHLSGGDYNQALLLKLVAGGICGAITGSLLATRVPAAPLRLAVLAMLVFLGVQLVAHGRTVTTLRPVTLRAQAALR